MSDLPDATVLSSQHDTFQKDSLSFAERTLLPGNEQSTSTSSSHRMAFVDKGLADIDTLLQGLENTRIILIDSQEDGIERITSELAQYQNIGGNNLREVHIFSHGDRGTLQLGNATFNSSTAARYDDNFQQWQQFLSEDADLLFYGCDFAATDEGVALVDRIARLSGADVAASNDLTGIGGDWQLEVVRGVIESDVALSAAAQVAYDGTLSLLPNGDFESGLAEWGSFTGTETVSETESFSGDRSLQLSAERSGVNQFLSVTTGETYTLTGAAKSSSGGYSAFGMNFFDENYSFLDGGDLRVTTNNWQTYQLEKVAPDGAQFVQVWAYKNNADGEFFVDGLVLDTDGSTPPPPPPPPPTAGEELLDNSGFESNLSSWGSFTGTESVSTTDAFAGGAALQMSAAGSGVGQFVSATPGEDYILSGYGKSSSTNYAGFGLNFFDGDYNSVGGSVSAQLLSGDWQLYERSSTAPPGTVFAQVWTYRSNDVGDVLFDQLSLKREGSAPPPADTTAPAAALAAPNLSAEGQTAYDFTVTYTDETAVDVSTLGQGDIRVNGPNGFTQVASFVGVDSTGDGTPRTATYRINAPNSVWQAANNGAYTVRLLNARVEDTLGNANAAANLGSFNINITDTPEPEFGFIGLESSTVSVDEAAGTAQVTVLRTGGSDGEITVDYSTVSSAGASAATAGEDYQSRSGTLTFADGVTQQSVLVPILDDTLVEGAENFGFAIDNVQGGATLLAPRTAQITINDDDTEEPPTTSQGNGLRGEYFNNINFTSQAVTRTDANIDFNWGSGSPDPSIGRETFSVRWSGQIEPLYSETYTFRTNTDDGIRLWVNNQLIIDRFVDQAPTEHTGTITLVAGEQYDIRMDYYENRGGAVAQLSWESASQALEIVPRSQLYSEPVNSNTPTAETVVSALDSPIAIDWRAGSDQMFIAEKSGVVRIFENGSLLSTPFIDISAQVNDTRDRGLIDLAIHPDFINNPYVYLSFTYDPPEVYSFTGDAGPDGDNNRASRVIRVTADAANGYRTAVPGSEVVLLGTNSTWDNFNGFVNSTFNFDEPEAGRLPDGSYLQDFLNSDSESHTIGAVEFGPDGALYVSNGDGTSYNRVDRRSARVQDVDSLSGKVLRIDPITGQGLSDNPFFNGDANANRSKVYQLGLRNPFRFTIDPDDGQLYIGDVGWTLWEEINAAGAGANFGWPYYEGGSGVSLRTGGYEDLPEAQDFYNSGTPVVASLLGLNHIDDGINAIVMGDIYKGNVYGSEYQGDLFFNDLGQGIVRNVSLDAQGNVASVDTFATGASFVVQMIEGPDGLLYYVNLVNGTVGRWVFD